MATPAVMPPPSSPPLPPPAFPPQHTHTYTHTHTHTHTPFFLMVSICLVSIIHSLSIAMNEWVSGGNALRLYVLPKSWWVDLLLQRCYGCCVRVPFSTLALRGQFRTCVCACALSVIPRKEKGWVVVMWGGGGVKLFESVSWFRSLDISVPFLRCFWLENVCGVFYISNMLLNQSVYQICVHNYSIKVIIIIKKKDVSNECKS